MEAAARTKTSQFRWLVLMYQLPPQPAYLRTKVWRRLQALGAIQVRASAYLLPDSEEAREDFHWLVEEISRSGGEAAVCESRLVDGLSDQEIEGQFNAMRDEAFSAIGQEAQALIGAGGSRASVARLRRRFDQQVAIDFFGARGRERAATMIEQLESRPAPLPKGKSMSELVGKTWVTRDGVFVDRIACAWVVKRFVDPGARFKFVSDRAYQPEAGELRFDMFQGEITHEGDKCSMEVLLDRAGLTEDRALAAIAEIVHDIDLKDEKFGRPETAGILHLLNGICAPDRPDEQRIARASAILNDLYDGFARA